MPAGLIPRILKKLLKGRMELFWILRAGFFGIARVMKI